MMELKLKNVHDAVILIFLLLLHFSCLRSFPVDCSMTSFIDSASVFKQRANEVGMSEAHSDRVVASGFGTLAKFAFSCNYSPGQADEAPLLAAVTAIIGAAPTGAEMGVFRRLFFEAYTLAANDLKSRLDRPEDAAPRRIAAPERAFRYEAQVRRLNGLKLEDELECSDSLIDLACQMFDDNRLVYIPWEQCTRKSQEIAGIKKDVSMKFDSSGVVRVVEGAPPTQALLATELQIRYALQRRGLALDQASLMTFNIHEQWVDKLLFHRSMIQPSAYTQISIGQLYSADQALFVKLCRVTRSGIIPRPDLTRPLDDALLATINDPLIMHLLTPFQNNKRPSDVLDQGLERGGGKGSGKGAKGQKGAKGEKGAKSGRKGKGKAKGKGKKASVDGNGDRICWPFNHGQCTATVSNNARGTQGCERGVHVCARPGCFAVHPMTDVSCPLWV